MSNFNSDLWFPPYFKDCAACNTWDKFLLESYSQCCTSLKEFQGKCPYCITQRIATDAHFKTWHNYNTTITQSIVRNYNEQLYAKKLDNLGEMDIFLETYNLPKLNQEEAESLNRLIKTSEMEAVIKKLLPQKSPRLDGFTGEF